MLGLDNVTVGWGFSLPLPVSIWLQGEAQARGVTPGSIVTTALQSMMDNTIWPAGPAEEGGGDDGGLAPV